MFRFLWILLFVSSQNCFAAPEDDLLSAVWAGDVKAVDAALKQGAKPTELYYIGGNFRMRAFSLAAQLGHVAILKRLIQSQVKPSEETISDYYYYRTESLVSRLSLYCRARETYLPPNIPPLTEDQRAEILEILWNSGVDFYGEIKELVGWSEDHCGHSPERFRDEKYGPETHFDQDLKVLIPMSEIIFQNSLKVLSRLSRMAAFDVNKTNNVKTPTGIHLAHAIIFGRTQLVEYFLKLGAKADGLVAAPLTRPYRSMAYFPSTPLSFAAIFRGPESLSIAQALLKAGAKAKTCMTNSEYPSNQVCPVSFALQSSNFDLVDLLIQKGAELTPDAKAPAYGPLGVALSAGIDLYHLKKYLPSMGSIASYGAAPVALAMRLSQSFPENFAVPKDVINFLIQSGVRINGPIQYGDSTAYNDSPIEALIHVGYSGGNREQVSRALRDTAEFLLSKGADAKLDPKLLGYLQLYASKNWPKFYLSLEDYQYLFDLFLKNGARASSHMLEDLIKIPLENVRSFWPRLIASGALINEDPLVIDLLEESPKDLLDYLKLILDLGASPNLQGYVSDSRGETTFALNYAIRKKLSPEIVELLLFYKANVDSLDSKLYTPLLAASIQGADSRVVSALLKAGASVNFVAKDGARPIVAAAIQSGSLAIVDLLVNAGASTNVFDAQKYSLIHQAIDKGRNNALITSLLKGRPNLDLVTSNQTTALTAAIGRNDNGSLVKILLNSGASSNFPSAEVIQRSLIRSGSGEVEKTEAFQALVTAGLDLQNGFFVYQAIKTNNLKIAGLAIARKAPVNVFPKDEIPTLILALDRSNVDLVKALIEAGVEVNVFDKKSERFPLKQAITSSEQIFAQVVNASALNIDFQDGLGRSALFYAYDPSKILILKTKSVNANLLDFKGQSSLWARVTETQSEDDRAINSIRAMLQIGADPNIRVGGISPLMSAIKNRLPRVALLLCQMGATDKECKAVLQYARFREFLKH